MFVAALVILGLALGSFVNALVWRLHEQELETTRRSVEEKTNAAQKAVHGSRLINKRQRLGQYSILAGRSMCPYCHHNLEVRDLVPIVSWVLLRRRCRYCNHPISWQYPVVEALTALLFVISYLWWPQGFGSIGNFSFVLWLVFLTGFIALAVYDIRWFLLPDRIVYPLILLAVLEVIINAWVFGKGGQTVVQAGLGAIVISGTFYLIFIASRGKWMGFGDVKLAIVLGLLAGSPLSALLVIFLASALGSLIAIPLLIKKQVKAKSLLPFGPFLLAATVIVMLFGTNIISWYSGLLYLK